MGLTGEQQVAAYDAVGKAERKFARDLVRKGTRREAELVIEIYHYFPGTRLVRNEPRLPPPEDPG